MEKDILIIGGGPGGYVAAIRAAQLGADVCLVEKDKLGGTCLNRGCIPTKALYKDAEILNTLKNIDEFGISVGNVDINVEKIHERKGKITEQLVNGIQQLLKANGVEIIDGTAEFSGENSVKVTMKDGSEKEITARNIIIATGSKPAAPPIPGADLEGIFTSEEILNFKKIPQRLIIIGGGVIGMEFAGIFNAMGTKVSVVEFLPNILAQVDTDLTKRLLPSLKKKGIDIHTSTKVVKIEKSGEEFKITAEGKKGEIVFEGDAVLISTGRMPSIDGLKLDKTGVEYDRKGIKTDENCETSVKGIYAIGDVNGKSMLAHAASHQGISAVEKIMGIDNKAQKQVIPGCIFIFPEIACAGITEDEAKKSGISYKTSKFMFGANGKAMTLGEAEGLVKVIADANGEEILGVHIMGPHASDLIHEGVLAITNKITAEDIIKTIHAHPTLAEAFSEAVMGVKNQSIHAVPNKK